MPTLKPGGKTLQLGNVYACSLDAHKRVRNETTLLLPSNDPIRLCGSLSFHMPFDTGPLHLQVHTLCHVSLETSRRNKQSLSPHLHGTCAYNVRFTLLYNRPNRESRTSASLRVDGDHAQAQKSWSTLLEEKIRGQ